MKNKNKDDFEDNGMTISEMNIDGMPFYDKSIVNKSKKYYSGSYTKLSKLERKQVIKIYLKMILPIGGIFILIYFLIFFGFWIIFK